MKDWIIVMKNRGSLVPFLWVLAFLIVPVTLAILNAMLPIEGLWAKGMSTIGLAAIGYVSGVMLVFLTALFLELVRMIGGDIISYFYREISLAKIEVENIRLVRGKSDARNKQGAIYVSNSDDAAGALTEHKKESIEECARQLAVLRTQTIMASNGLMVDDNQTVGRISEVNKPTKTVRNK